MGQLSLLSTQQLVVGYAGAEPLTAPLTLTAKAGQLIVLLGRNGIGKSTLLRTLAGLHAPHSGGVALSGLPLRQLTSAARARLIAYSAQAAATAGALSVIAFVRMGRLPYADLWGRLSADDHSVVAAALALFELEGLTARRLATLSDGQRQRAQLARAWAQSTPLLLLDEPTAHLDAPSRVEVWQRLTRLAATGRTLIVATHEVELASPLADKIWLLHNGHLHAGSLAELRAARALSAAFSTQGVAFDDATLRFRGTD